MVEKQAFIQGGQSLSGVVDLLGLNLVSIVMPNNWTAANLTFQGSDTKDGTYKDIYDSDGNEVVVSAAANRSIDLATLAEQALKNFDYIKVRSGTTGSPVVQAGDKPIKLLCEEEA
jgi:hypothetical protein